MGQPLNIINKKNIEIKINSKFIYKKQIII